MREKLIQYVNLLFAGAADSEEIRQEILQNTLDRYDDLVEQGKSPEAAYRLAISGIGDINEILDNAPQPTDARDPADEEQIRGENQRKHAISIAMYILCPIPLFLLDEFGLDTLGLCLTLILVAAATALRMTMRKIKAPAPSPAPVPPAPTPRQALRKSIGSMIWAVGLALYFIISFATDAWMVTWIIFPLIGAVQGLVNAIVDLKEANEHEI